MAGRVDRDAVRVAALRALVLTATDPKPERLNLSASQRERFELLLLDGIGERGIAAALGLTLDDVRATLIRLARPRQAA